MSDLNSRSEFINKLENLIQEITTSLENEQQQSQQKKNNQKLESSDEGYFFKNDDYYGQQGNLSSTIDVASVFLSQLSKFKEQFEQTKEILLLVPLEKTQCQQYLAKNLELYRSKLQPSLVRSLILFNNSEIERQKVEEIKKKLQYYIEYQPQQICPIHKQIVEQVNISGDLNFSNRLLCKQCGSYGLNIQVFLKEYLMDFFEFKINSETTRSIINKQIQDLSNLILSQKNLNILYNDLNAQFQQRISIIDDIAGSQINNIDKLTIMANDYVKTQDDFLKWNQQFIKKIQEKRQEDFEKVQSEIKSIIYQFDFASHQLKQKDTQKNIQNFPYIYKNSIKQLETCQVLSFNRNDQLIATAKANIIVIWNFQNCLMNPIAELKGHQKEVSCLFFDKNSETLISCGGDYDRLIILWKYLGNNKWIEQQRISNTLGIKVIDFDYNKNLLIVGCQKGIIKTFEFQPEIPLINEKQEIELESTQAIYGLSLNPSKTFLVSCGQDSQLRMLNMDINFKRNIVTNCDSVGTRVKFIDDQSFVLVQRNGWFIYYKIEWNTLKEMQRISLSSENHDFIFTPIYYNSDKQFLVVKHYKAMYFLRRSAHGYFEKQTMPLVYESSFLYATISNNGKFLVTWIDKQNEQTIKVDLIQHYHIYELQQQNA
ncbi:unnamed protein product (macronuclear) [Paramecium tetraurelia]|uniref:Anaphase-promoting complex subunit 4 WD40 domain-containing protein n=1 Tax=Paramecium tetraurelia TaxID=5888 RepID=A0BQP0_PARTE|nr:uncharacterized protein GSPATT00031086001 [Paramecium tetraurelia]CAK60857.1 unnamed protein product [Paramecium tetraurelia]|eukprot:XP_001428255.1 hypothetical protein (macronuclear) [Paramecium tetraurelia strain d4-2]